MRLGNKATILIVLLAALGIAANAKPQTKRAKFPSIELCPDEKTYTGKYRNWSYGFSIVIPVGRKAYWNSARCVKDKEGCVCMSDHGRSIELPAGAYIEAYAGFDVLEWSLAENEKSTIEYLSKVKGAEQVEHVRSGETQLGKLRAGTYLIRFIKNGKVGFEEEIVAVHKGVEYTLTLRTWEDSYAQDRQDFQRVVASWKLTKRAE